MPFTTVNYWLIWHCLGFLEIAEAEKGAPLDFDPDDELQTKTTFNEVIKPEVDQWDPHRVERLKNSLAYFIDRVDILNNRILANLPNLTLREPKDIRRFFNWLWECLFPEQSIKEVNLVGLQEDNDVMQINVAARGTSNRKKAGN